MTLDHLLTRSQEISDEIHEVLELPRFDSSDRIKVSHVACSLAVEHWDASRILFGGGYVTSAISLHRLQFEALIRAFWLLYSASDTQVSKLASELSVESAQKAKNLPLVTEMMESLAVKAPKPAYNDLRGFYDNSWRHLNSFVHAGIHPIYRLDDGYPVRFVEDVIKMSNALGIMSGKQASALAGSQLHMVAVQQLCYEYSDCGLETDMLPDAEP